MTDEEQFDPPIIRDKDGDEIEFPEPANDPPFELTHSGPEGDDPGEPE